MWKDAGFSVVRDLVGHGIGKNLHEEPSIPNFGTAGTGVVLQEGMTLADRTDGECGVVPGSSGRRRMDGADGRREAVGAF